MNQGKKHSTTNKNDVGNVESLLKGMSLNSPSEQLDGRIEKLTNPSDSFWNASWFPTMCVAAIFMVSGFAIGRMSAAASSVDSLAQNLTDNEASTNGAVADFPSPNLKQSDRRQEEPGTENSLASDDQTGNVRLIDQGLFLLDGKFPVRKFVALSKSRVKFVDPVTGEQREVDVPVRRSFISHSPGT